MAAATRLARTHGGVGAAHRLASLKNGALLSEAERRFEVLLTMDSNMVHQQNLAQFRIAVIALQAKSNRLADTRPLMPKVLAVLAAIQPGTLKVVSGEA